ncbi:hypothetical protein [Nitratireductor indicus]|uniref:Holin n=1 Tax=Nitratireductor indicus C115 TaxID=1231190 RepID=K2NMJ8_9HYPH|nr:hypothetical protein [Nitratireductor indicus]EKF40645.1 hypothetical protein NA8A_19890 [Nitratireductor indicus C115]MDS1134623.1 hypothetical protein [Nitratireductor indicus]SFQ43465.1 hypothetical protein SAMN05216176_103400 [Nitratireductor indicus]
MTDSKPWYLSRTIWASMVTIATAAAGILGYQVDEIDSGAVSEGMLSAISAISGLIAIFGRVAAKSRIL